MAGAWKELNATSDGYIAWTEPGQTVEGILSAKREGNYAGGLADVDTSEGARTFGLTTMLARLFAQIEPGTRVRVEYLGEERSRNGHSYKNFAVAVFDPDAKPEPASKPTPEIHQPAPSKGRVRRP
jgi:hypothetical protein